MLSGRMRQEKEKEATSFESDLTVCRAYPAPDIEPMCLVDKFLLERKSSFENQSCWQGTITL